MTDTNSADGTQAAPPTSPQAGEPPAQAADAQQSSTDSADDGGATPDVATLQRELAAARREAAQYRTKAKGYEDAQKTDSEKAAERIAELERTNSDLVQARRADTLRIAASAAARELGFRNPDIAYRLVAGSVEFDDKGEPKGVKRLLEDLAKTEPYLTGGTSDFGGGPRGSSPGSGQDMNTLIRQASGRH